MTNISAACDAARAVEVDEYAGPNPRVSVIMANYNGARYLEDAIESVRRQTLANLELLVCDDASADESVNIIERYSAADDRIKLIRSETNAGPSAARNRGLAAASGSWLAIMDSDDIMHPARLKTLIANAARDGAGIAADDLIVFYQDLARRSHGLLPRAYAQAPFWVDLADFIRSNVFYSKGAGLGYLKPIIRADLLRQTSCRYDETLSIGEDYDFVLRLLVGGLKYRVYPRQLYFYRKHGASISHRLPSKAANAMLDSDRRFRGKLGKASAEVRAAFEARSKSIETVLAFNGLIEALKSRHFADAAGRILRRPKLLLLLREPVLAWFGRIRARRGSPVVLGNRLLGKAVK
ncbi:MAG: glycosyltransferase family 2 protein [Rhodomicrobium sp.]